MTDSPAYGWMDGWMDKGTDGLYLIMMKSEQLSVKDHLGLNKKNGYAGSVLVFAIHGRGALRNVQTIFIF